MSTPSFFGRSLTCPFEAITSNLAPRYFLIVLAFAGDSTTTSVLRIGCFSFVFSNDLERLEGTTSSEQSRRPFYYYVLQGKRQERRRNRLRGLVDPGHDGIDVKCAIRYGF